MAHFDAVLPGRIYRVIYEALIDDTQCECGGSLRNCGLPYEEACLRFYENDRRCARELATGAPADLSRRRRSVAPLRAVARAAEKRLGPVLQTYPASLNF